jgi:16S rRNA (guanine527-N7)-methyltransferase
VISKSRITEVLEPFGLSITAEQTDRLLAYLELLIRWNSKINLVGPASDEECVTRHFGESLFLQRWVDLKGRLLDIGSGAGFPGLALKIICPGLDVTLLEPIAKKRAFLKEVARACLFDHVSVFGSRMEEFSSDLPEPVFDFATSRAVGGFKEMIDNAELCLNPGGRLCLWIGQDQAEHIKAAGSRFRWAEPKPIPLSRKREIWLGELSP